MKSGYCITTRRFTLRCKHREWLVNTQRLYGQVLFFYYQLLLDHPNLHGQNNREILRGLEILTIPGRDKAPVEHPLPWGKIPLYFRRSAINAAVALLKSMKNREGGARPASSVNAAVVYYKGMYQELDDCGVSLKVYDGEIWRWMHCRLSGDSLGRGEGTEVMSPTVVIQNPNAEDGIRLHVPVKEAVEDIRTARERMAAGENLCSVLFTNSDAIAVACVLDASGRQLAVEFIRGGKEYGHRCKLLLDKIHKSDASRGGRKPETERTNEQYWMRLKHLSVHYAHQVSRRLVGFCEEHHVRTIVLPAVQSAYAAPVMKSVGNWSPLHLSVRIREFLPYKAWKAGMVVLEASPGRAGRVCALCGAEIKKMQMSYECTNGHRGNRYLNTARNLGRQCQEDFEGKLEPGSRRCPAQIVRAARDMI